MKQSYFANHEFRKYLLYALGEMALVIIGILIALQIDNWNTEKLQQETLKNYFRTIARNIDSDLASINEIRSERVRTLELSVRWRLFGSHGGYYDVPELTFAGQVLSQASALRHFNASSSGYEALKSSGTLDQLQGTDIERLLYDYYDTVARTAGREKDHNDLSRLLTLQVWESWPEEFERWELMSPYVLTRDRFASLQPAFQQVLQDSTTQELIGNALSVGSLLLEYDRLDRLGRAFQRSVEIDSMDLDETALGILDGIYDPRSGVGQPSLIADGQTSWHSHYLISSDANDPRVSYEASAARRRSPFNFNSFQRIGDSLHIDYQGGAAWAGMWLVAGTGISDRRSPDSSMYEKLLLELKGDAGGEKIVVNMEDRDDPPDGTSTRIELQLSDSWQTYEIDLAEFETANLSILTSPLGFVFSEEPVSFSVRTAKFVKAD
jgi:hypothetical protein